MPSVQPLLTPLTYVVSLVHVLLIIGSLSRAYAQEEESFAGERPPEEETTCETPDVLLLLDRSGSMLDDDKWGQATNAVTEVFVPYFDTLRFGLMTFPTSGSCGVTDNDLAISIGEANASRLDEVYASSTPTDEALTPLSEAIRIGHLALQEAQVPNRRGYMILLTDGIETCAPAALEDSAPIASAREAADQGFNTYVIGFGSLVRRNTLREMARVGGTERERLVSDQSQLVDTLTEIIDSATTERCDRLDNDCDGRVDEGIDCEPSCNAAFEDCPCDNNLDCALGELCEEGLCAAAPCSALCDTGYICFEDQCILANEAGPNGGGSTPPPSGSQGGQFGDSTPSTQPMGQTPAEGNGESMTTSSESCQSQGERSSLGLISLLLIGGFLALGPLLRRVQTLRES